MAEMATGCLSKSYTPFVMFEVMVDDWNGVTVSKDAGH